MIQRFLQTLLFLFLIQGQANASRVMGGEVTYRHLGELKYEITFKFYRDCRGLSVDSIKAEMRGYIGSTLKSKTLFPSRVSIKDVSNYCKKTSNPCSKANTTGAGLGIEEHLFLDTVDFNKADSAFKKSCYFEFGFGQCCRNTGTVIGSGASFWVMGSLNICKGKNNSSPIITSIPNNIVCCNQPLYYSIGAIDTIDHDSISYSYVEPMESWTKSIPYPKYPDSWITSYYPPGYDRSKGPNPTTNPPIGVYLNPETGDLTVTPGNCSELPVVSFKISEWRKDSTGKYNQIGEVRKDIQYVVQTCPSNNPPTLNAYRRDVCAGNKICITVTSDDKQFVPPPPGKANPPDTVSLTWNFGINKGATFKITDTTARLQSGQFCWTPKESDASDIPYSFTVTARDNNCPSNGIAVKSYSVKVKKIAKAKRTYKFIKNGLYEVKSELEKEFKGSPSYFWEISDSSNLPLDTAYYFHSNGKTGSNRQQDSVQFYHSGKYIIHHRINNAPLNCPSDYFDTIKVGKVTPVLRIEPTTIQEKWVCKNTTDTIFPILKNARKPVKFRWSRSSSDTLPYLVVNISQDVIYRVDVYDSAGYHRFAEWSFYVYKEPELKMGNSILACVGDTVSLAATASNFTDTVFWKWFFEGKQISSAPKIKVVKPGLYSLEISDSNQCSPKQDTIEVNNMSVNVNAGIDRKVCISDTVMLNATGLDTSNGKKGAYYWYINTITPKAADTGNSIPYKFKTDGTMIARLVQSKGILTCTDRDTVAVSFRPLPEVLLGNTIVCQNENELDLHTLILKPANSYKGIVSWQLVKTLKKPNGMDNALSDLIYDKDNSSADHYYLKVDSSTIDLGSKFIDSVKLALTFEDEFGCRDVSSNSSAIEVRKNLEVKFNYDELKRCHGDSVTYVSDDYEVNYYGGQWFTNNDSSNYLKWPQGNIVQLSEKLGTSSLDPKGGKYLLKYTLQNNGCFSTKNAVLTIVAYPAIAWSQSEKGDSITLTDKSTNTEKREWYINNKKMSVANTVVVSKTDAKTKVIVLKTFNGDCGTDSTIKPVVFIGIKNENSSGIHISPNPVSKEIRIHTLLNKPYQIEIVNNFGQTLVVRSIVSKDAAIDVSHLSPGIYNLIVKTGNEIFMHKFLKI